MDTETLIGELRMTEEFFNRSTAVLREEHSEFRPTEDCMSCAQQVAHVAHTVDWFFEGAFRPEGFDMDFAGHAKIVGKVTSLEAARDWLRESFARARADLEGRGLEDLMTPLPAGPIMGGQPRLAIISAIDDHSAHHRGALTVYARLNGLQSPMPYM